MFQYVTKTKYDIHFSAIIAYSKPKLYSWMFTNTSI
nr:MAG TPA: hypothetical protein [Caudoviricetes sp.]